MRAKGHAASLAVVPVPRSRRSVRPHGGLGLAALGLAILGCQDPASRGDARALDARAVDGSALDAGRADAAPADGRGRERAALDASPADASSADATRVDVAFRDGIPGDARRVDGPAVDASPPLSGIVFAERVGPGYAPYQVFAMKADGTLARQLTSTPGYDNDEPTVSPDGRLIAFASKRDFPGRDGGMAQNPTVRMLYLMNSDGTEQRRLTRNSPAACTEHHPRFSGDGKWVTFDMSCGDVPPFFIAQVYRIRVDGSAQQKYSAAEVGGNQVHPVFSADDRRILFVGPVTGVFYELYSIGVDGNDVQRVTHSADQDRGVELQAPMPAAGTDLVYFVSAKDFMAGDQKGQLEVVKMDGSGQQLVAEIPSLTSPPGMVGVPQYQDFALSPAGDQVVFVAYDDAAASPPTFSLMVSTLACSCLANIRRGGGYAQPFWR